MRLVLLVSTLVTINVTATPSAAQSADPNVDACINKSGDEAIAGCTAAIKSSRLSTADLAVMFYDRGVEYGNRKDYDRALSDYSEAIRLNPKDPNPFAGRGNIYRIQKDYARAIADNDEAIRLNPNYALAFNNRGNIYRLQKDFRRAIADYDEAIRINPKYALALYGRGLAKAELGQIVGGKADVARALAIDPHIDQRFK